MFEIIKEIIREFINLKIDFGVFRNIEISVVRKKATICIGVRRGGKSTFLFQTIHKLLEGGAPKENILYLNFFDDRLRGLQTKDLAAIIDAYYFLYPHKKGNEVVYCFFDEIQMVPHWESFIDRLLRTELCEIYITGSSAQMLSREIATQMRGRSLSWEIFPFSFREFLVYKQIEVPEAISSKERHFLQNASEEYWQTGAFPEVMGLEPHVRRRIHQEYFHAVLFHDLIDRHDVSHPKALIDLGHRLIQNVGSLYTINALLGYLKSLSHKITKSSVSDYLAWFEDAYFLFSIKMFDASAARANANPKKIYCIDHALVTSISPGILINSGHLLENLVFVTIRRFYHEIFYYKTKQGREVDFVFKDDQGTWQLVQVCQSLAEDSTRKREVTALNDAMKEQGLNKAWIVTRSEEEKITCEAGLISVVAMWRFLLDFKF